MDGARSRRLRLTVEYDGTDFVGWQRQANGPSVQAAIEDAIERMSGAPTAVRGAGRTDAGVHALGQVAHFDTRANIPVDGFRRGLNSLLPRSVAVADAREVASDFDARFSARGKLYRYQLWTADSRSPIRDRFMWHVRRPLEVERMRAIARLLVGKHDFRAFRASDCERRTTTRNISRLEVLVRDREQIVSIEVEADAFLKNMVRILVGTLVAAGHGKRGEADALAALSSGERRHAGMTAPPHGLCLVRVDY